MHSMSCVIVQAPTRVIARASQRAALPCASGSLLKLCCETLPHDASDCGRHSVNRGTVSDTRADDDYSYSIARAPLPRQPAAAVGSVTRCCCKRKRASQQKSTLRQPVAACSAAHLCRSSGSHGMVSYCMPAKHSTAARPVRRVSTDLGAKSKKWACES